MAQPRISRGFRTGGQFARKPRPKSPPLRGDVYLGSIEAPGDDDPDSGDRSWLDISEDQRKALLQETEIYLAELTNKKGYLQFFGS